MPGKRYRDREIIKGVLFDIGDTVIHVDPSVGEIYARVCREKGMSLDPEILQTAFRSVWDRFSRLTPRGANRFAHFPGGEREWWSRLVREVMAKAEIPVQPPAWYGAFEEAFLRPGAWKVYPEAVSTLKEIRRRGLIVGAISNWDSRLAGILALAGLAGEFDPLVVSAIEGMEKPSAELFNLGLKRCGLAAGATIYVGNRPEEDYRGAEAAGLRPLLIDRKWVVPSNGMIKIRSLREVLDHI